MIKSFKNYRDKMTGKKKKWMRQEETYEYSSSISTSMTAMIPTLKVFLGGQQNHKETLISLSEGYIWQKCCF